MKTTTTIPRTCQTRNLIADLQIWHRLQDNKWFYATSKPTQISIVCSKEDSITQVIKRSGIIRLDSTCQAYTDQVTLHSQRILPGHNLTNEIPVTDITEDDCCKKLKRNISVNAIYMEPLKLTNLDLNELKYAQEKLNQFDEQLQQQLNKPFIVKQSHWYTTIISVITVLIILLILYKLLRFFGCVQYLRRCRKSESPSGMPCLQIFNQCHKDPIEKPTFVHYDAELQRLSYPIPLTYTEQEHPVPASPPSGSSVRRSSRLHKKRVVTTY